MSGKATRLFELKAKGFNVPRLLVVSAPLTLEEWQTQFTTTFGANSTLTFAVRSSASLEDSESASFAGLFETYLNVSVQEVPQCIEKVMASAQSSRVKEYQQRFNIPSPIKMAVIVQEMVPATVSGVAFSQHPMHPNEALIQTVHGLGDGLVSGQISAESYSISAYGHVEYATSNTCLSDEQLQAVYLLLKQVEAYFKVPQDIEFAFKNNELFLLQARPITTLPANVPFVNAAETIVWDNSNVVESYPGITTPLTFSAIKLAYSEVYENLARLFGATEKQIEENKPVFENMIGLIKGRVYYNLFSWYRVLSLFPMYSLNARYMEDMMGVKERFQLPVHKRTSGFIARMRVVKTFGNALYWFYSLQKKSKAFITDITNRLHLQKQKDLTQLSAWELLEHFRPFDDYTRKNWQAPLVNDTLAMIFFGTLKKLTEKWLSSHPNLHNDLLCGNRDIISTQPIYQLQNLSTAIYNDSQWLERFRKQSPDQVWTMLLAHPEHTVTQKIQTYINDFGYRCIGELKLESVSYKEDPTLLVHLLQKMVQAEQPASWDTSRDLEIRKQAELLMNNSLKNPLRKILYKYVLKKTRYFVSNRENLRYIRTQVYGHGREVMLAFGKRFENEGALDNYRDIFYLTKQEIYDFIQGTAVTTQLKALVHLRKSEFEQYHQESAPSIRIKTHGMVYMNSNLNAKVFLGKTGQLQGIGCSPGIITGKVRKVMSPFETDSLNGDILVTAATDPGWVVLFPSAGAIAVERGSLLSHSAIVSREMGIPCVVGVNGLLDQLETGDWITLDGSTGLIQRIEHP